MMISSDMGVGSGSRMDCCGVRCGVWYLEWGMGSPLEGMGSPLESRSQKTGAAHVVKTWVETD